MSAVEEVSGSDRSVRDGDRADAEAFERAVDDTPANETVARPDTPAPNPALGEPDEPTGHAPVAAASSRPQPTSAGDPLEAEIADALGRGDVDALEALAEADPFAVSGRLASATDRLVADPATDDFHAFDTARRTIDTASGRGTPLAYAIAVQQDLDAAGVGDPAAPLESLDDARALVAGANDTDAYPIRDALDRASARTGIASADLGLAMRDLPPARTVADDIVDGVRRFGDGLREVAAEATAYLPNALSLGYTLGRNMPMQGAVVVSMPVGEHGINSPLDFTATDGTPGNSVGVFLRPHPQVYGINPPGHPIPVSVAVSATPELANLPGALTGDRPLVGEDGFLQDIGVGGIATHATGRQIGGLGRIPGVAFGGSARTWTDSETGQSVTSLSGSAFMSLPEVAANALIGVGSVASRIPHPATRAAGSTLAIGGALLAQADDKLRDTVGTVTIGASWTVDARSNPPGHPDGAGFDGFYKGDRRLDLLSDAYAAELADPLLPAFGPEASLAVRMGLDAVDGLLEARGLPGPSEIGAALPDEVRDAFDGYDADLVAAWQSAEAVGDAVSLLPTPATPFGEDVGGAMETGARIGAFLAAAGRSFVDRADRAVDEIMADGHPDELVDTIVDLLPDWIPGLPREPQTPLVPAP